MFFKQINTKLNTPYKVYRDENKTLIELNSKDMVLTIRNFRGCDSGLHGCLVARFTVQGRQRYYRCKTWGVGTIEIYNIIVVKDYKEFFKKIRTFINK